MRDAAVISRRGTDTPLISVPARDADEIRSPTSSIITKDVVKAYSQIAGDFAPAVPFALLEARRFFARQAASNPADSDENTCRKVACEAIARRIVQRTPMEEQYALLSKRYTVIESDGDESLPTSALESAVDQRATYFLSSNEAQRCVFAVWKGLLVQKQQPDGNIEYERETQQTFSECRFGTDMHRTAVFKIRPEQQSFWWHFDPQRIAVPRYQFFFRVGLWILFLVCYTLAIQTPDRGFGPEDIILYTQLLGYLVEDLVKVRLSCLCSLQAGGGEADICFRPCRFTRSAFTPRSRSGRSSTGSSTHSLPSLSCAVFLLQLALAPSQGRRSLGACSGFQVPVLRPRHSR